MNQTTKQTNWTNEGITPSEAQGDALQTSFYAYNTASTQRGPSFAMMIYVYAKLMGGRVKLQPAGLERHKGSDGSEKVVVTG